MNENPTPEEMLKAIMGDMSMFPTLQDGEQQSLLETVMRGAREIFTERGHVFPMLFCHNGKQVRYGPFNKPEDPAKHDEFFQKLSFIQEKAVFSAWVTEIWMVVRLPSQLNGLKPPSECDDRKECVAIHFCSNKPARKMMIIAEVRGPKQLGPWQVWCDTEQGHEMQGRAYGKKCDGDFDIDRPRG